MKKLIKTLTLTFVLFLCFILSASAENESEKVTYQIIPETGIMIVSGEGRVGKLLTGFCEKLNYDGYYGEDIYDEDYSSLYEIKTIIIEEGITQIGHCAFLGKLEDVELLKNLETVVLPESLVEIEDYAFYNCEKLTKIYLPSELKKIGSYALSGTNIKQIHIPDSVETIGYGAFANTKIKNLTVPETVTEIREICNGCDNLKTLSFTNATCLVRGCDNLTKISYSAPLTKVEIIAENCPALQEVVFDGASSDKKIKIAAADIDKFLPGCPEATLYLNENIIDELEEKNISYAVITEAVSKLSNVKNLRFKQNNTRILSWSPVSGAGYYQVYEQSGGVWTRIYSGAKTSIAIEKSGKYRVRAVNYDGEKRVYSKYTTINVTVVGYADLYETKADGNKAVLQWSKAENATGYQIYYSNTDSKSGFKKLTNTSSTKYTVTNLKDKPYYFKVRAYYKAKDGTYQYSTFSYVRKVK
ncbi:MAG: fibronectin type III domain-containing protein [Clostridia bacterium]|nr:fibronectin type III domain-containing protein [Clostridia bacterium]